MSRAWYVLHVKPRTEKKVFDLLRALGVFRYLPLLRKETRVQRRRVVRHLPLFPGYVFTRLAPEERRRVMDAKAVVRFIDVPNPRQMIHQLRQIEHAKRLPGDLRPTTVFKEGELVKVASGPFRGIEGYVRRRGRDTAVVLLIDILGQALEVSLNPEDVEKAAS